MNSVIQDEVLADVRHGLVAPETVILMPFCPSTSSAL